MATLSSVSRGAAAARAGRAPAPVSRPRPNAAVRCGVVVASADANAPIDEQPTRVSGGVIGAGGVGTIGSTLRASLPSDYAKAKIKVRRFGGHWTSRKIEASDVAFDRASFFHLVRLLFDFARLSRTLRAGFFGSVDGSRL